MKMFKQFKKALALLLIACLLIPSVPVNAATGWRTIAFTGENTDLTLSVGESGQFETPATYNSFGIPYTVDSVQFYSYNTNIISVDASGNFQVLGTGYTSVTLQLYTNQSTDNYYEDNYYDNNYYYDYGDSSYYENPYISYGSKLLATITYGITVLPDLSNVTINSNSQTQYMPAYSWYCPSFTFQLNSPVLLSQYTDGINFSYTTSNPEIYVYGTLSQNTITLTPSQPGKVDVTIKINEKTFVVHLKTVVINLSQNSLLLTKSQTKQLKMKGISGKVKWSSSNPKVATVSSSGKVTAKGNGNAVIKAEVGDYAFGCAVSVVTPNRKKTIQYAINIAKTSTYSQPKRMQKGYYDCSSLVWRSYSACSKITFGNRNYAPVAADLGKWCASNKKLVKGGLSQKNINQMKLNAGDLMFETGANNGRYKGIYHVEMITGYACYGFYENGDPYLVVTWASRPDGAYGAGGQMVGRP